jgi:hypothetical protein
MTQLDSRSGWPFRLIESYVDYLNASGYATKECSD